MARYAVKGNVTPEPDGCFRASAALLVNGEIRTEIEAEHSRASKRLADKDKLYLQGVLISKASELIYNEYHAPKPAMEGALAT